MFYPSLKMMKSIDPGDCQYIPLYKEIYSDLFTPVIVLKKLKNVSEHCFLLESREDNDHWGRYTFIGFHPKHNFTCKKGRMKLDDKYGVCKNPAMQLRKLLKKNKSVDLPGMPPFTGGLVGYFAYDYLQYSEPTLCLDAKDDEGFKDVDLMLFDEVICFDHFRQKILLIVNVDAHDIRRDYKRKCDRLNEIENLLKMTDMAVSEPFRLKGEFTPFFSKKEYCEMVEQGKHHIKEGDIFQIVLSNRIEAKCAGSLLDTYRVLRTTNPSPYMFYFSSASLEVAGSSPETLIKLEGDTLYTVPIAGTRKRGKNEAEDEKIIKELLSDEKELAEHNMLVDLGRNDLGKISKMNSVKVLKYKEALKFSHVIHIATEIKGTICEDKDALDAIETMLPAGTLSGAPKIKAVQIINDLENNKRGIYGGAFGYLDLKGNMDTCIGIRMAYKRKDKVFVRSGAGIVNDSIPEMEFEECLNKAGSVIEALHASIGGIDR